MPHLLTLRGRHALSPFRVAKLGAALTASRPDHAVVSVVADYWHFVEVARALTSAEQATLERLLTYGARDAAAVDGGELLVVIPRPGTVSPWSSKATDIAHNCGLSPVVRIERGVGFQVATRGGTPLAAAERDALAQFLGQIESADGHRWYERCSGLCLPHLRAALAAHPANETAGYLLRQQARRLEEISEDMRSYVLKRQALRRGLAHSEEESAWRRALVQLVGERNAYLSGCERPVLSAGLRP